MNVISRRSFVKSGMWATLGMALGAMLNVPICIKKAIAEGVTSSWNGKKLFFIFLRGGNDGINSVIPLGDDAYLTDLGGDTYSSPIRPTIFIPPPTAGLTTGGTCPGIQPERAVDLGNGFAGLHPSLHDLCDLYNDGDLSIIHRVGYLKQSRSHFDSQWYWENGIPQNNNLEEGIFYRTVEELGLFSSHQLPAISLQQQLPLLLKGELPMANIADPDRYDLLGVYAEERQKQLDAIRAAHNIAHPVKDNRLLTFGTGDLLIDSLDELEAINFADNEFYDTNGTTHLFPIDAASNQKEFANASFSFFEGLKNAAQILAESDTAIVGTELGGFDTHNNQGGLNGGHPGRLEWVGWALYALRKFMQDEGIWNDTVIVTMSEFGRTSLENGSNGTDHAEAAPMFVTGGPVKGVGEHAGGGIHQCDGTTWTTGGSGAMFETNNRYLSRRVDYRSVLGELIRDHLGASQSQLDNIIPGYANPEEKLLAGGTAPDGAPIVGELGIV